MVVLEELNVCRRVKIDIHIHNKNNKNSEHLTDIQSVERLSDRAITKNRYATTMRTLTMNLEPTKCFTLLTKPLIYAPPIPIYLIQSNPIRMSNFSYLTYLILLEGGPAKKTPETTK